jgi:hypothetical protein
MKVDEEIESWNVISNTDLTEGKGGSVILHHCTSRSTAIRLSKRKGVQGSDAHVNEDVLFKIDGAWYGQVMPEEQSRQDYLDDVMLHKYQAAVRKAAAAGLTHEEIELLQGNYDPQNS